RGWMSAADGWGLGEDLLATLRGARILARGPKVKGAVRAAGLTEEWSPSSESMAEVLERLLAEGVDGLRVAIQLHGEPLPGFVESLRAGGAEVVASRSRSRGGGTTSRGGRRRPGSSPGPACRSRRSRRAATAAAAAGASGRARPGRRAASGSGP